MTEARARVVVGVDGSAATAPALEWAAGEAARRNLPLELLHARVEELGATVGALAPARREQRVATATKDLVPCLEEARRRVEAGWPGLEVSVRVATLGAPYALVTASAGAAMVAVGARGRSLARRVLLGSVSHHVAAHARCPAVVVKRTAGDPQMPVVVGIDDTTTSHDTLEVAVEEALARGVPLVAVHAWVDPAISGYGIWAAPPDVEVELRRSAERLLTDTLEGWTRKHPDLEIHERLVRAHPVDVLLGAAEHCQLLVVGSHGLGAFPGMLIGSVASAVVQHADCPVVVVPARAGRSGA